ncbi:pyocin activator protein PrtN [Plasticicumulans lactativorans]|uniref:Pyocin activator protein PrtN n=1 Tax=Plasticicumulans lactativorans TaxID=1133106 RepID=A0A4V2SCW2_9GAMM|nr:pyocin activator protein PrtN [Plasticicumulans lactativorans]
MSAKHQPLPLEALGLQIQFGGRYVVPLAEIAEDWFGLNEKQAKCAAARQRLPVPAFKLREGERCNIKHYRHIEHRSRRPQHDAQPRQLLQHRRRRHPLAPPRHVLQQLADRDALSREAAEFGFTQQLQARSLGRSPLAQRVHVALVPLDQLRHRRALVLSRDPVSLNRRLARTRPGLGELACAEGRALGVSFAATIDADLCGTRRGSIATLARCDRCHAASCRFATSSGQVATA